MKQIRFSIQIAAPKEKVWHTMFDDPSYRIWANVFHEGSYALGDWTEGSKMLFLGPEQAGMVSRIFRHSPNEFMSIQHLGTIKDGVEDLDSEVAKQWAGALENYSAFERGGLTELIVEIDVTAEYESYFQETWPKALEKLKELCEKA